MSPCMSNMSIPQSPVGGVSTPRPAPGMVRVRSGRDRAEWFVRSVGTSVILSWSYAQLNLASQDREASCWHARRGPSSRMEIQDVADILLVMSVMKHRSLKRAEIHRRISFDGPVHPVCLHPCFHSIHLVHSYRSCPSPCLPFQIHPFAIISSRSSPQQITFHPVSTIPLFHFPCPFRC